MSNDGLAQARPEQRIAAVAHWGVIYALTGELGGWLGGLMERGGD